MTPPMARVRISPEAREDIRRTWRELQEARQRADKVDRPDGTDGSGHPGIRAANLEGYLGSYTMSLLVALEQTEARLTAFEDATIHVAGVPARLTAHATVEIEGVPEPVELPLKLKAFEGGIALAIDPAPAMVALADASDAAAEKP